MSSVVCPSCHAAGCFAGGDQLEVFRTLWADTRDGIAQSAAEAEDR